MTSLIVTTPPAVEPVSAAQLVAHARIDADTPDENLLNAYISAARSWCEMFTRRAFITTSFGYAIRTFPQSGEIVLPRAKVQSVESVTYTDKNGSVTTLDPLYYVKDVDSEPGRVMRAFQVTWPFFVPLPTNAVKVGFTAGYGPNPGDVPQMIQVAIMQLATHMYQNREMIILGRGIVAVEVPFDARAMLEPYRVYTAECF